MVSTGTRHRLVTRQHLPCVWIPGANPFSHRLKKETGKRFGGGGGTEERAKLMGRQEEEKGAGEAVLVGGRKAGVNPPPKGLIDKQDVGKGRSNPPTHHCARTVLLIAAPCNILCDALTRARRHTVSDRSGTQGRGRMGAVSSIYIVEVYHRRRTCPSYQMSGDGEVASQ